MSKTLQDVLNNINKLPENFLVALKVTKMLDGFNMNLDIRDLTKTISLDPSLTTLLLKLCNSAHYGFSRKIVSINDAITKLGFRTLKNLVFVAVSQGILNQEFNGYDLNKGDLWKNALSCAVYARHFAEIVKYRDPDTAFTAGLLRDIGKIMIHEYVGANYTEIINLVEQNKISFLNAEDKILGFNHCTIGAEIAARWDFPPILTDMIRYHHELDKAIENKCEDVDLISIIHVADSITMMMGVGLGSDGMMYNLELKSLERFNIPCKPENIEQLLSDMVDLNEEIQAMAGIVSEN